MPLLLRGSPGLVFIISLHGVVLDRDFKGGNGTSLFNKVDSVATLLLHTADLTHHHSEYPSFRAATAST
jgi:hypothetical protein